MWYSNRKTHTFIFCFIATEGKLQSHEEYVPHPKQGFTLQKAIFGSLYIKLQGNWPPSVSPSVRMNDKSNWPPSVSPSVRMNDKSKRATKHNAALRQTTEETTEN